MKVREIIQEKAKNTRRPTRSDCKRPASDLSAKWLAICKCKGWKARTGKKSHKIGPRTRITVGGKKIKGKKCGGPLPDYGSRK